MALTPDPRENLREVLRDLEPATAGVRGHARKSRVGYLQQMIAFGVVVGLLWLLFGQGSPLVTPTAPRAEPVGEIPRPWIAVSSPAISDTLWQLGLVEHIVGRSPYCRKVPNAVPVVGDLRDFDAERLALAKPDVLFVQPPLAGVDPALRNFCEQNGIRLLEHRIDSFADTRALVHDIAAVFKTQPHVGAAGLAGRLGEAQVLFERFADATPPSERRRVMPRVLLLVSADPFLAVGRDNYLDELLAAEGFENALDRDGWIELAPEAIVTLPCDAVLAIAESARGAQRCNDAIRALPWSDVQPPVAVEEAPQLLAPSLIALTERARIRKLFERAVLGKGEGSQAVPTERPSDATAAAAFVETTGSSPSDSPEPAP